MYIVIFIILFFLARFTIRGLFDRKWYERGQTIIDIIRNEKFFWQLMNQDINAERVFSVYLRVMNQKDYVRNGDLIMGSMNDISFRDIGSKSYIADPNDFDKNIITRSDGLSVVNNQLNPAIQDREKIISEGLSQNHISFSESEIRKEFESLELYNSKEYLNSLSNNYGTYIYNKIDSLVKGKKTETAIWEIINEIAKIHDFEYERGGENHVKYLYELKIIQAEVSTCLIKLLSKKIEDKELIKALVEWQQLCMLRWCVASFTVEVNVLDLNKIEEKIWRTLNYFFL